MIVLNHAYILHRRLYRDSSLILEFFTAEQGIVSVVARGARNPKSKFHSALQYFTPLLMHCYGKSELLSLKSVEINGAINLLSGKYLLSMLYINELLYKLFYKFAAHSVVFFAYQHLIEQFLQSKNIEEQLRIFEMQLLQELGYGIGSVVGQTTEPLDGNQYYTFCLENGFQPVPINQLDFAFSIYPGHMLQKIQQREFTDKAVLVTAKQLFRQIFTALLQHKRINSRELFAYRSQS